MNIKGLVFGFLANNDIYDYICIFQYIVTFDSIKWN